MNAISASIGTISLALLLGAAALATTQDHGAAAAAEPAVIYYDYVDGGVLLGGKIRVDPDDPQHTATGGAWLQGSYPWVPLVENGPSANRIDLVFVGDGYTTGELGSYATHVNNILPVFMGEFPFDAYATYFNVYRVDVASNQSGVDNDPSPGISKDTALDMGFWCGGIERLLCVNVGKANAAASSAPAFDLVLAVANSLKYGGAGYPSSDLATLSGNNGSSIEIALHEVGHALGNLADEYDYGDGSTYTGPEPYEPNVSIYGAATMDQLDAKWHLWLPEPNVDTYEGAYYKQYGIYRPTSNSKMRALGRPFEQVNVEQLIVSFYREVRPIDDASAPGERYQDQTQFYVTPLQPATHALDIQWSLNGTPVPGARGPTLDVATLGLAPGRYLVSVRVTDGTDWVRDEALRQQYLSEERSWTYFTSDIGLTADPAVVTAGTTLELATSNGLTGTPALLVVVQVNGLPTFTKIASGTFVNGRWTFRATVPPGLAGYDVVFRSFGLSSSGRPAGSNPETVSCR
ncbi:MAG: M64 family metallopeptidase [Planctomycetota bacterium]